MMLRKSLLLLCWLPCFLLTSLAQTQQSTRPNILFIIADDWSYPHAGIYGDNVVKTPNFDRIASEGALFTNAYCASPSCTPSRASLLTGRAVHQLEEGGNLYGPLAQKFVSYPTLLEEAGYAVGSTRKGWGPGTYQAGGYKENPAGKQYKSFEDFYAQAPQDKPFCFWFGSNDPHRPYDKDTGLQSGMKPEDVIVPPHFPDTPEVRKDILDYYFEVQRMDRDAGEIIKRLEADSKLDNTLIIWTSDNGMPFPRSKANLYNFGTHMPLAVRWPRRIKAGQRIHDLVVLTDVAPTMIEAAGLKTIPAMTGRSWMNLLAGKKEVGRAQVFLERERHANVRRGDLGYPVRAIRTKDFLYIRNLRPDRWPAGDPEMYFSVGDYGDIDDSPTKQFLIKRYNDPVIANYAKIALDKRPAEELYDLQKDPGELKNIADDKKYANAKKKLRAALDRWMETTEDPRANPQSDSDVFDRYSYSGGKGEGAPARPKK